MKEVMPNAVAVTFIVVEVSGWFIWILAVLLLISSGITYRLPTSQLELIFDTTVSLPVSLIDLPRQTRLGLMFISYIARPGTEAYWFSSLASAIPHMAGTTRVLNHCDLSHDPARYVAHVYTDLILPLQKSTGQL